VAGWPNLDRVDDRRLAESLAAADTHAIAQIYDAYAERLYDYCHALLRDQDGAAGALHDALIAAQAHIGKLREPERFRGWLYAIIRNECLRRMYDPARPAERREAPELEDPYLSAEDQTRLQETRQLVHSALSGLNGRQREAADLALRHDLDVQELAGVLGISAEQATELAAEAQSGLDDALAAAIIARSGRGECPSVAALVDTWEWPLTPAVCKKLIRHIEICPTCSERRKRKVSTTRLLQVLPIALVPVELREQVIATATAPDLDEVRVAIAQRAEPFDVWGWPTSLDRNGRQPAGPRQRTPRLWPAVAAAACVMFVVGAVFLYLPRSAEEPTGNQAQGPVAAEPSSPEVVSPSEEEDGAAETAEPTDTPTTAPATTRVPTTTRPPSRRPTRKPTTRPATPKPQPRPGTVSASGGCNIPPGLSSCTFDVVAAGGDVSSWSASTGSPLSAAAGGGSLEEGEAGSVTVSITRPEPCTDGQGTVTLSPGGRSVAVSWSC
jgi:RNA polymerase sigma factor (sigma-70 family)